MNGKLVWPRTVLCPDIPGLGKDQRQAKSQQGNRLCTEGSEMTIGQTIGLLEIANPELEKMHVLQRLWCHDVKVYRPSGDTKHRVVTSACGRGEEAWTWGQGLPSSKDFL